MPPFITTFAEVKGWCTFSTTNRYIYCWIEWTTNLNCPNVINWSHLSFPSMWYQMQRQLANVSRRIWRMHLAFTLFPSAPAWHYRIVWLTACNEFSDDSDGLYCKFPITHKLLPIHHHSSFKSQSTTQRYFTARRTARREDCGACDVSPPRQTFQLVLFTQNKLHILHRINPYISTSYSIMHAFPLTLA